LQVYTTHMNLQREVL